MDKKQNADSKTPMRSGANPGSKAGGSAPRRKPAPRHAKDRQSAASATTGVRTGSSRAAAFKALRLILLGGGALDAVLADAGNQADWRGLSVRDRAFARLLITTVLRRLGQIDDALARYMKKVVSNKVPAKQILRLGAAQLLFLDTPAHAALNETVALAASRAGRHKSLVNAVLRKIAKNKDQILAEQDAERLNCPDWLWQSWSDSHGEATCRAMVAACMQPPPLDLTCQAEAIVWAEKLGATLLPTGSLRLAQAGIIDALPGFEDGAWWVQDAAAAMPARLLGDVSGQKVIDLCAAPGGKTLQLAAAGGQVTAVEISPGRSARITENLHRTGLTADLVIADSLIWRPSELADAVLLDAPCSATGMIRRQPDIWHRRGPEDVTGAARTQAKLLPAAAAMVRPGGILVYAVCSLEPEEGPDVIAGFLASAQGANFQRYAILATEIGGLDEMITAAGDFLSLPSQLGGAAGLGDPLENNSGGLGGFYACRLRRRA